MVREQFKSNTFRYGENPEHRLSVKYVIDWWNKFSSDKYKHWAYDVNRHEIYSEEFIVEKKMRESGYTFLGHHCDLVYEVVTTSEKAEIIDEKPMLFIEIDGPSHSAPERKILDGIFKDWVELTYPGVPLVRIPRHIFENTTITLCNEELATIYLKDYIT